MILKVTTTGQHIVSVQSLSHGQLFATPWTDCSMPGSPVLHYFHYIYILSIQCLIKICRWWFILKITHFGKTLFLHFFLFPLWLPVSLPSFPQTLYSLPWACILGIQRTRPRPDPTKLKCWSRSQTQKQVARRSPVSCLLVEWERGCCCPAQHTACSALCLYLWGCCPSPIQAWNVRLWYLNSNCSYITATLSYADAGLGFLLTNHFLKVERRNLHLELSDYRSLFPWLLVSVFYF